MAWIIQGVVAAVWTVVEPLLLYGLATGAVAAFVAGVVFLLPAVRPWAVLAFLASLAAGSIAGVIYGQKIANRDAELGAARARIKAMERDVAIAKSAEADAEIRAEAQAAHAKSLEIQVSDYDTALAARPDASCTLDDDDLDSLRRLGR
jgi:hypothetical protein